MNKSNKAKIRKNRSGMLTKIALFVGFVCAILFFFIGIWFIHNGEIRLDQYSTTILGTTAGVVGTMFGLTAASYAFIWADLRSDRQENRHIGKVLELYRTNLWCLFVFSLLLTVIVVLTSLIGLALVQNITEPSLFKLIHVYCNVISEYQNDKFGFISIWTWINLYLSIIAVILMARMNWFIFKRDIQYSHIAETILESIQQKYDMSFSEKMTSNTNTVVKEEVCNTDSIEYEKIHNLEILVERILKNHESIGDAFAESQRREKLLTAIITNMLNASYDLKQKNEVFVKEHLKWNHLNEEKRITRLKMCFKRAMDEYDLIQNIGNRIFLEKTDGIKKPCDCDFISVYDDLLTYRDNSLVCKEKNKKEKALERTGMYEQRALRYTIKKRLLIFYLRGEMFSNMDLSGVSFSGADLRGANFSDCNLTGIRLKGTNCEGTDFTRSRMTGMYFADVPDNAYEKNGEIQLSCIDVPDDKGWDPYKGRETTYLRNATFKEADVSHAYLNAPGKLSEQQVFPFGKTSGKNIMKYDSKSNYFSLEGTNFDYAKIFFSYFKNVDFTNSSLEKAQMYNTGLVQTKAKSTNFTSTTLTNACIVWCDFENADFSDASLVDAILVRTNFRGANMRNVNFSNSNIVSCNFEGASCQNASFKNMVQRLSEIKNLNLNVLKDVELNDDLGLCFNYATLTNTDFSGAELNNVSFFNSVGQNCIFTKTKGENIKFDSAIFNCSVFNSDKFEYASMKNTIMQNSVFINVRFINSIFEKTDFSGSIFTAVDRICFSGGYMQKANFSDIKGLTAANFKNIYLENVNFTGTGIQKSDFFSDVILVDCIF